MEGIIDIWKEGLFLNLLSLSRQRIKVIIEKGVEEVGVPSPISLTAVSNCPITVY